ncbi:AAA family ATPase [Pseudanabaena yagii]|uniref:AAA family ATPase n=1 Tax=Pseudanabaena yagii GIHE-NHR1 TaxID=2722753 RepID=A0ABX1LXU1_9CYAN|nr:AAA family ATPase [Pseudanabaena yagii]NMF60291.1 AAA family ATPase [Pseudanabaena yagii GIHE-NHR1]
MHLQRVQVPDFRVLKDVDITFEKNFNPRVFPLGSQNGGGKSTLLQLIFVLLHCPTNPERLSALKNLIDGFNLRENENKRVLAKIDIWDGEKSVELEFFVCGDTYIDEILNFVRNKQDERAPNYFFQTFLELEDIQQKISEIPSKEITLQNIIEQIEIRNNEISSSSKFPDRLKTRLLSLDIDIDSIKIDYSDANYLIKIEQELKLQLSNKHLELRIKERLLSNNIHEFITDIKSVNIEYITICSSEAGNHKNKALLCSINNKNTNFDEQFLNKLSNKIFLAAPSTQVFLFLNKKAIKSLFNESNDMNYYQSELTKMKSDLSGLFTYDFLATNILIKAFKNARDKDFKEALKTGEYGKNYQKLLKDLDFLLHDKQVNFMDDFSGLTFKLDRFKDSIELYPEDLSHGELKRLSIYIWLKYQNIEDAIVLMDEVDLALHPDWQYQIVSDLLDWVPSNQYILATHSYELCNALTPSHVKILEPKLTERRSD